MAAPRGLSVGGRKLWNEIEKAHALDESQRVQLHEACRIKDRLDKLDAILTGDVSFWVEVVEERGTVTVSVDSALSEARQQANQLKQLIAALRLPDEVTGKRPQHRGGARGAYGSRQPNAAVSSLERARARKSS